MTQLRSDGYELVGSYRDADIVVINTCGFIDAAKQESFDAIDEALAAHGRVIVTGCLGAASQRIREHFPAVLSVTGPHDYDAVRAAVHRHLPNEHGSPTRHASVIQRDVNLTPAHYAYLKISEGCNHHCSFCIIPKLRGRLHSRPIDDVLGEAERLVQQGVRELLVISQDTSAYGSDIRYAERTWQGQRVRTNFLELCRALSTLGVWVRVHYVYPYPHVDAVIPLMTTDGLLPYLDIPFQHASPAILKKMRRPAHAENVLQRITSWRQQVPDITIRSTFIVGFPGESDADFESLLAFLRAAELDRVGCFKYSPVDGAAANDLPDPVSETEKQSRYDALMQCQQEISRRRLTTRRGQTIRVLIDAAHADGAVGRGAADAPEIDGQVHVVETLDAQLKPGDFVSARIVDSDDYDLFACLEGAPW